MSVVPVRVDSIFYLLTEQLGFMGILDWSGEKKVEQDDDDEEEEESANPCVVGPDVEVASVVPRVLTVGRIST